MKIEHLAIWVTDLETMKDFYQTYFDVRAGEKYMNEKKQFHSYFLSFVDSGARLELNANAQYSSLKQVLKEALIWA